MFSLELKCLCWGKFFFNQILWLCLFITSSLQSFACSFNICYSFLTNQRFEFATHAQSFFAFLSNRWPQSIWSTLSSNTYWRFLDRPKIWKRERHNSFLWGSEEVHTQKFTNSQVEITDFKPLLDISFEVYLMYLELQKSRRNKYFNFSRIFPVPKFPLKNLEQRDFNPSFMQKQGFDCKEAWKTKIPSPLTISSPPWIFSSSFKRSVDILTSIFSIFLLARKGHLFTKSPICFGSTIDRDSMAFQLTNLWSY